MGRDTVWVNLDPKSLSLKSGFQLFDIREIDGFPPDANTAFSPSMFQANNVFSSPNESKKSVCFFWRLQAPFTQKLSSRDQVGCCAASPEGFGRGKAVCPAQDRSMGWAHGLSFSKSGEAALAAHLATA